MKFVAVEMLDNICIGVEICDGLDNARAFVNGLKAKYKMPDMEIVGVNTWRQGNYTIQIFVM